METVRTHRVGSITTGFAFIAFGVMFILHLFLSVHSSYVFPGVLCNVHGRSGSDVSAFYIQPDVLSKLDIESVSQWGRFSLTLFYFLKIVLDTQYYVTYSIV